MQIAISWKNNVFAHSRNGGVSARKGADQLRFWEKMIDTTDEWIRTRTGIERRHLAADGQATSDLSEHACRAALDAAGMTPADIDLVVVGHVRRTWCFPMSPVCSRSAWDVRTAFSIEAACSGFIYSLSWADKFIRAGQASRALVCGAEVMSRIIDWTDRETCVLFGDGAAPWCLKPPKKPAFSTPTWAPTAVTETCSMPFPVFPESRKRGRPPWS